MFRRLSIFSIVFLTLLASLGKVQAESRAPVGEPHGIELSLGPSTQLPGDSRRHVTVREVRSDTDVPSLRLSTMGPDTLLVGKPASYVISLTNLSDFAARDVAVRVSLPSWVKLLSHDATLGDVDQTSKQSSDRKLAWSLRTVRPQGSQTLQLGLLPEENRPFDLNVDLAVQPSASRTRITVQEPKLELNVSGPKDLAFGQAGNWKLMLINRGTGDADDVQLHIQAPEGKTATQQIGTVRAGTQHLVSLRLRPQKAGKGELRFTATGEPGLSTSRKDDYLVRRGQLEMRLQGPDFEYAGARAEYQVRVINSGNAPAKDVAVSLSLPPHTTYVGGLQDARVSATGVSWTLDHVDAGKETRFNITAEIGRGGEHAFQVKATTRDGLAANASLVTRAQAIADLKLEVLDPKGPQRVGSETEYEIHVTNRGTDTARQISVIANCSPDVQPLDVTGNAAIKSGQIFFRPITQLEPNHKIVRKVKVRARKAGNHEFRVVVRCYDPDTRLASQETTRFFDRAAPSRVAAKPARERQP